MSSYDQEFLESQIYTDKKPASFGKCAFYLIVGLLLGYWLFMGVGYAAAFLKIAFG
jgi:hypothetical protein